MENKVCSKCKEEKMVCEFYKNTYSKDNLRSNCKTCQNKNSTKWRLENNEEFNEVELNKGSCVEFKKIGDYWYVLSSDGLKS